MGIIWASDFKFEVVGDCVNAPRPIQCAPADSITQELRDNLRKLSLGGIPTKASSENQGEDEDAAK